MSYIVNEPPPPRCRRTLLLVIGAVMVVVALVVAAFLAGRAGTVPDGPGGSAGPAVRGFGEPPITWSQVGDIPVPESAKYGPFQQSNGLAAGFSHDELGAALAAINISARMSGPAGPLVYETTMRQQGVGDVEATIDTVRRQSSTAAPGTTVAEEYFYRITSGDPENDLAVVSVAAVSAQSRTLGGYAEFSRTLQWVDGDWKIQIPPSPPRLVTSIETYESLGRTDG